MQRQLAVYEKCESYHSRKARYDKFFSTTITSTTNTSASCCGSKDARASNGHVRILRS